MIDIRTDLLPIKAHFLLFFGGISPIILFIATLAKQLGFSAVLVGTIFTVLPLLGMTSKLIMGAFADRFQCHKSVIIVFLMITLICFTGLMFIPPINRKIEAELVCNSNSSVRLCSEMNQDKCIVSKIKSEHKINTTVHCQMECSVDDQFIESVCTSWNGSRYCELPINTKKLKSTVKIVNTKRIFTNISNARNTSTILFPTSTTSPILRFDAQLLPYNIEQEGRCLSVQIGGIKDETDNNGPLHIPFCEIEKEYSCQMVCDSPVLTDFGKTVEEESTIKHYQFWIFVLLMSGGWIGTGTITSVGETVCFGLLGDKPSEFGKQRLWGSLGWGIMSLVGGLLVDTFSNGRAKKNYTPIFITSSVLLGLDLLVSLKIKDTKRKQSKSIMWDIGKLLMNIRIIIYLVWCVLMGISNGIIANFLFWHLEDLTDCDGMERIKTLEGLYVTIQSFCGELPFFFLNCWVLNKLGHVNAMSAMLFTFGTIFVLFSVLDNPLYFLPISLLNGITFSTMYATMASYASIIAPPGTEATMQGLVGSVYEGIGLSFGNFMAGILMHYFKGAKVFRIYGIAALALCILHVFLQFLLERSNNFAPVTTKKDNRNSVQYTSPNNAVKMLQTNQEPEKKP